MKYNDPFGQRIKEYEAAYETNIIRRLPIIIRLDGKGFSKVTKHLPKPCYNFCSTMALAMQAVAKGTTGCVFGYCQSDEVTLVLKNDQSLVSQPAFDNRVQKLVSLTAADMTYWFNHYWPWPHLINQKLDKAIFDARVFAVPSVSEMISTVWWRQVDCIKNAISLAADAQLSEKFGKKKAFQMLHKQGQASRLALLKQHCDIDFETYYKSEFRKGCATYRVDTEVNGAIRKKWILDIDIPLLGKDRTLLTNLYDFTTEETE